MFTLFHVSVSINYDCTPAGDVIAGRANARNHCCTLELSRAVLRACCTCPVAWSHVKGHSGNPWNELCDALANGVADGRVPGSPGVFPHPDLAAADPHALRWAAELACMGSNPELPPVAGSTLVVSASLPPACRFFESAGVTRTRAGKKPVRTELNTRLLQYNAETLLP